MSVTRLRARFFVGGLLLAGSLSSCLPQNAHRPPPPLAQTLESLAQILIQHPTCAQKSDALETWLREHRAQVETDRDAFLEACPNNTPDALTCMGDLLLATARLEYLTRACQNTPKMRANLAELNALAGSHIDALETTDRRAP